MVFKRKLQGSKTYKLLKEAFTLECYGELRCKLFASIAQNEGLPAIATAFNEVARSQNIHAINHFNIMRDSGELYYGLKTGSTIDNLKTALTAELHESDVSAGLIKVANDEGFIEIAAKMEEMALAELANIHRLTALEDEII
ncbi:MAG: ferritin family protein [Bdellovibrionota bacterium]